MKKNKKEIKRCWEFFHCLESDQKKCMIPQALDYRCWLLDLPCCKMDPAASHPLSIKKSLCKNCEYYKEYFSKI